MQTALLAWLDRSSVAPLSPFKQMVACLKTKESLQSNSTPSAELGVSSNQTKARPNNRQLLYVSRSLYLQQ